jgi:hypothetical protein
MQVQTKFLQLFRQVAIGDHIDGWRVCWIGGWDKCRVLFVRMVEKRMPATRSATVWLDSFLLTRHNDSTRGLIFIMCLLASGYRFSVGLLRAILANARFDDSVRVFGRTSLGWPNRGRWGGSQWPILPCRQLRHQRAHVNQERPCNRRVRRKHGAQARQHNYSQVG